MKLLQALNPNLNLEATLTHMVNPSQPTPNPQTATIPTPQPFPEPTPPKPDSTKKPSEIVESETKVEREEEENKVRVEIETQAGGERVVEGEKITESEAVVDEEKLREERERKIETRKRRTQPLWMSLCGEAAEWFKSLAHGSITTWLELEIAFLRKFANRDELDAPAEAWFNWSIAKAKWAENDHPNEEDVPTLETKFKEANEQQVVQETCDVIKTVSKEVTSLQHERAAATQRMWNMAKSQILGGQMADDPSFEKSWKIAMNHEEWEKKRKLKSVTKTQIPIDVYCERNEGGSREEKRSRKEEEDRPKRLKGWTSRLQGKSEKEVTYPN